jgi:hypothetical protein
MAFCHDPADPIHLTPEQRLEEIAALLATGVLRLQRRAALTAPCNHPEFPSDSSPNGLDESPERRLHGHRG